jgi:hypothetical protein
MRANCLSVLALSTEKRKTKKRKRKIINSKE